MAIDLDRYRFDVDQYDRMVEQGVFAEDDRIELVGGEIVRMAPIGDRHAELVDRLVDLFSILVPQGFRLSVQNPIRLSGQDKPQPDLALVRRPPGMRRPGRPTAANVELVVEVADSSLRYDHLTKARLYARHGISEYWVIDLKPRPATLTVYREPGPEGYAHQRLVHAGEPLGLNALPELRIDTEELLGD